MDINFPLILVLATFVTGLIWLIDRLYWQKQRLLKVDRKKEDLPHKKSTVMATSSEVNQGFHVDSIKKTEERKEATTSEAHWIIEMSRSFFPVLLVVLILRSFLVEPFQIPSGSMLPTLEVGDFILVNKFAYGVRLPVIGTKILDTGHPHRGDVFVFHYPVDGKTNYIKRVIGLPGDHIRYTNKTLYINGKKVPEKFITNMELSAQPMSQMYQETLGKVKHDIYLIPSQPDGKDGEWTVPKGEYFAMGDNRDNSDDSRYWGFVPEKMLVGRAFGIWMQWKSLDSLPSFSRVGAIH